MFVIVIVRCSSKFVVGSIGNDGLNIIIMVCVNICGDFMYFFFMLMWKGKSYKYFGSIV